MKNIEAGLTAKVARYTLAKAVCMQLKEHIGKLCCMSTLTGLSVLH